MFDCCWVTPPHRTQAGSTPNAIIHYAVTPTHPFFCSFAPFSPPILPSTEGPVCLPAGAGYIVKPGTNYWQAWPGTALGYCCNAAVLDDVRMLLDCLHPTHTHTPAAPQCDYALCNTLTDPSFSSFGPFCLLPLLPSTGPLCPPGSGDFVVKPGTNWQAGPGTAIGTAATPQEAEALCSATVNCVAWNSNGSYVFGNASAVTYGEAMPGMCVYVKENAGEVGLVAL